MEHKITLADYLMGRTAKYPISDAIRANAQKTVDKVNEVLALLDKRGIKIETPIVNSGYRPPEINAMTPGSAKKSKHMVCLACDINDPEGIIDTFFDDFPDALIDVDVYREHPSATKGWCHIQVVPPASGRRTFYP